MSWNGRIDMNLGVFGGTFDPPHIGHLVLAMEARFQLGLDKVLWVLTPNPPHKEGRVVTPVEERLELLRAALRGNQDFVLSRVDIERPAPHFAFETMQVLRKRSPVAELTYLMGGDELRDLPSWKLPLDFLAACHALGVMHRPGAVIEMAALEKQLPGVSAKVCFFETPLLEISASEIRRRASEGEPFHYYVPEGVYRMILMRGLYQRMTAEG